VGRPWYEHIFYPDWMIDNEDYDNIRRQESKTHSLEQRVNRLEEQVKDLQRHVLGLEALLASHGIVPPTPEKSAKTSRNGKSHSEPVTFPARTEENIACPNCGRKQKGNRNACYFCAIPFQYENE